MQIYIHKPLYSKLIFLKKVKKLGTLCLAIGQKSVQSVCNYWTLSPEFIQPLATVQHEDRRVRPLPSSKKGLNHKWAVRCHVRGFVNRNIARRAQPNPPKNTKRKHQQKIFALRIFPPVGNE